MVATALDGMAGRKASNWINGVQQSSGTLRESIDPATYAVIGCYPDDGLEAAKAAVAAASEAFRETEWARDHELRARVLEQLARAFERNRDRLPDILSLENGKVKAEAAFELDMIPSKLRYSAATALSFESDAGAAIFGTFTYTSKTLGKTVTSPFAVLARVKNGRLSYVQFMEDTFATVRSFRESGEYHIKANPDGGETDV